MKRASRGERGQAVLETALGGAVTVVMIVLAMHLHEIGYGALKVQQSATSLMWDATGRSLRPEDESIERISGLGMQKLTGEYESNPNQYNVGTRVPEQEAILAEPRRRFMEMTMGASMYTQMAAMELQPKAMDVKFYAPLACRGMGVLSPEVIDDGTKLMINASAEANLVNVAGMVASEDSAMMGGRRICGVGRAYGTECPGSFFLVQDDWSVRDGEECDVRGCINREYNEAAQAIHDRYMPGSRAASAFAEEVTGQRSPLEERDFYLSFKGPQSDFTQATPGEGRVAWRTGYGPASRGRCFLGLPCQ